MVKDCAALTEQKFKPIHAFYIRMLTLRYHTPRGDRVIWPNQYTWLLQQGLIKWEGQTSWGFSTKRIRDKSRADSATKLISLIQVSCFVLQSILRSAHALPLSQLESMALSYIPLFTVTYFSGGVNRRIFDRPPSLSYQQRVRSKSEFLSRCLSATSLTTRVRRIK